MARPRIRLRIPSPLIHRKLWRFLGLFSSLVGLICYALSSSFRQLFGEWNSFKLIIYCVVSLCITSLFLFSQKLRLSRSFLLKVHLGFLVLMITTFYSFFSDKSVRGKPDIFSLISCASFSLMSLSLSKHTNLGFEGDLLTFFLGCLTVQLMKVHLMLGFLAAIFCYFIIVLRSRPCPNQSQIEATQAQDHQSVSQIEMEIDSVREIDDTGNGPQSQILQTMSGDEYNWKKYEVKQVKGSEKQMSFYKCSIPKCPVKKRVESYVNGQICDVVYKGTHNHGKPITKERNSSFETLYATNASNQPFKAFFFDRTPYQPLQNHENEQLDPTDSSESSSVSV
ncbi:uncharacterized protein LOC114759785 [Neltuma alba]|uniref:uncharacterized protein LOC114759785 n=1 Tax=Neltuma alba TaxID=207710 RepID=UPI0010A57F73|nr:uncharacterized protein LOC114759785 [Prosopis alba]